MDVKPVKKVYQRVQKFDIDTDEMFDDDVVEHDDNSKSFV